MLEFQIPHHLISLFSTNRTGALSRIFSTDLSPKKTPVISGHNSYQYGRKFSTSEEFFKPRTYEVNPKPYVPTYEAYLIYSTYTYVYAGLSYRYEILKR